MLAWWKNSLMEPPMERLLWLEFLKKPFPGEDYRNSPTCEIHVLHPPKASCYSKCCCIYKGKTCAFVINCFITNYHKHIGLNQSTFMIPQLLWSGVRAWLSWVCSQQGFSQGCSQGEGQDCSLIQGPTGEGPVVGRIQQFTGCKTEGLRNLLIVSWGLPSLPGSKGLPMYWLNSLKPAKEKESVKTGTSWSEVTILCNIMVDMAAHHHCHILLVRSKPQVPSTLKGRGFYRGVCPKRSDHRIHLRVYLIQPVTGSVNKIYATLYNKSEVTRKIVH